ncbi:hypothetical protein EBR96_10410, partial [bacterium]|nr:hypothetical protein [bacterium]
AVQRFVSVANAAKAVSVPVDTTELEKNIGLLLLFGGNLNLGDPSALDYFSRNDHGPDELELLALASLHPTPESDKRMLMMLINEPQFELTSRILKWLPRADDIDLFRAEGFRVLSKAAPREIAASFEKSQRAQAICNAKDYVSDTLRAAALNQVMDSLRSDEFILLSGFGWAVDSRFGHNVDICIRKPSGQPYEVTIINRGQTRSERVTNHVYDIYDVKPEIDLARVILQLKVDRNGKRGEIYRVIEQVAVRSPLVGKFTASYQKAGTCQWAGFTGGIRYGLSRYDEINGTDWVSRLFKPLKHQLVAELLARLKGQRDYDGLEKKVVEYNINKAIRKHFLTEVDFMKDRLLSLSFSKKSQPSESEVQDILNPVFKIFASMAHCPPTYDMA